MKSSFLRLLRKLKLIRYVNSEFAITFLSQKVTIPVIEGMGLEHIHMTEIWMTKLFNSFKKYCPWNSIFIDVGANSGQTLLKLKTSNLDVQYYGMEPNPACVHYLNKLIRVNNYQNAFIIPLGASAGVSLQPLYFYEDGAMDSSASMVVNFRGNPRGSSVITTMPMDELLHSINAKEKITIIKIDVEGFEADVLEGAQKTITQHQPILLLEVLPTYDPPMQARLQSQQKIQNMLKQWNYQILRVIKKGNDEIELMPLPDFGIHSVEDACDYVLLPAHIDATAIKV